MVKGTTKEKILHYLKKDHQSTMKEIADQFTISEIAVRKHVHELARQGFVKKRSVKQKVGRPYYTYELTEMGHQTFPNQYESLPVELLQDIEMLHGEKAVKEILKKRMDREKKLFSEQIKSDDFDQMITDLAKIQEEKGYMIEYKKLTNGSYEIKNFNCPIINIASTYNQVCKNEQDVLAQVFLASQVDSHQCITKGDHYCKWTITAPLITS